MHDAKNTAKAELLKVLQEVRALLALPDNDFAWSCWDNATEALSEFDRYVANIEAERFFNFSDLSILFAPTAPIQEVSLSSGWGQEFVDVAARFDAALYEYQRQLPA